MALIPERIFEKFLLSESEPYLSTEPQEPEDIDMEQRFPVANSSNQSSQGSQPTPMLGDGALHDGDSAGSPRQFETLQNCQQPPANGHPYPNEDSQASNFEVSSFLNNILSD